MARRPGLCPRSRRGGLHGCIECGVVGWCISLVCAWVCADTTLTPRPPLPPAGEGEKRAARWGSRTGRTGRTGQTSQTGQSYCLQWRGGCQEEPLAEGSSKPDVVQRRVGIKVDIRNRLESCGTLSGSRVRRLEGESRGCGNLDVVVSLLNIVEDVVTVLIGGGQQVHWSRAGKRCAGQKDAGSWNPWVRRIADIVLSDIDINSPRQVHCSSSE